MKNWLEDLNKTLGLGLILAFIVFLIRGYYGILGEIGFWALNRAGFFGGSLV